MCVIQMPLVHWSGQRTAKTTESIHFKFWDDLLLTWYFYIFFYIRAYPKEYSL
jgi:hypothetical protein